MIYGYGLWKEIEMRLMIELPLGATRNLQKYNRIKSMIDKNQITKDDLIFFLRFSRGDQNLQDNLEKEGYKLFPNPKFSTFIRNREEYMKEIDKFTRYPLKRVYVSEKRKITKDFINHHFQSNPVVLKVGNLHASEGKYLINESRMIPRLKYKFDHMPATLEEFIPDARSIRIGIVGEISDTKNFYITEHINSKTWLKNNNPEEEKTFSYAERGKLKIPHIDELIEETKMIAQKYHADLLGVDWVVSECKTGILELNDMVGMPDGEFAFELFYSEIKRICEEHIK